MPTAYLSPSLLRELTDVSVSNPGAGETGRLLTWNGSAFVLRTSTESRTDLGLGTLATQNANAVAITGGAISGITPLPIASGGTGSNNGSITGTGALTFAAGGTNSSINISGTGNTGNHASGPGNVFINSTLNVTSSNNAKLVLTNNNSPNAQTGILIDSPTSNANGYYIFVDEQGFNYFDNTRFKTCFIISKTGNVGFGDYFSILGSPAATFEIVNSAGTVRLLQGDDASFRINQTQESSSTTTGACIVAGGLGVAKNLNIGGNLRFAGGTVPATATSAGTTGDVRYDGDHLYICTATNTWRRTALSTW